jgi:imidazole glycerol phosphate synthase, glutamine amidotransferase subunit
MSKKEKNILIIDYQIGNVSSVINAIKSLGHNVSLSNEKKSFENATHLILPGVGSFEAGMSNINNLKLKDIITEKVKKKNIPILGICLGMQLLASEGYENNILTKGLNLIDGKVELLNSHNEKLPHIGWNSVKFKKKNQLNFDFDKMNDFYFVHSYFFNCKNQTDIFATTCYGSNFPSIVQKKNIIGVQFHPEKSLEKGMKLLKNFLNLNA